MKTAKTFLLSKWALIPAAYHVGAFPSLAIVMSSAWIGSMFTQLERILGRALAVVILTVLNGFCFFFVPMPLAVVSCVAQVIGFITKGLVSHTYKDYNVYGEVIKSSDRAWDMIFGITGGVGVGLIIKNQIVATAHLMGATEAMNSVVGTALGVAAGRSFLFGATGNAVVLVKQVYLLFTRVQDGKLTWDSVGAMLTTLIQTVNVDITTGILCALVSIALIAVRSGLRLMKYQAGVACKTVRQVDGTNTYVEDFFGSFDSFALSVLSTGAILSSPSSLISVLIAWIGNCSRRGEVTRGCFKDAFEAYAGVPIAIAIISEGVGFLARGHEEKHSMGLLSMLCSIPSLLAGIIGCVYWFRNPDVHTITKVWQNVTQFVSFLWDYIKEPVGSAASFLGDSIGSGIMNRFVSSMPGWMKNQADNLVMEEKFSLIRNDPLVSTSGSKSVSPKVKLA